MALTSQKFTLAWRTEFPWRGTCAHIVWCQVDGCLQTTEDLDNEMFFGDRYLDLKFLETDVITLRCQRHGSVVPPESRTKFIATCPCHQ